MVKRTSSPSKSYQVPFLRRNVFKQSKENEKIILEIIKQRVLKKGIIRFKVFCIVI